MKWDHTTNDPPIMGAGCSILLNGERIRKVRAFDTEEGWARVLCLDDHSGQGGHIHLNPENPTELCEKLLRGVVTVEPALPNVLDRLVDWLVATEALDRWRGTNTWIGRIVRRADVRWVRRHVRWVRRQADSDP